MTLTYEFTRYDPVESSCQISTSKVISFDIIVLTQRHTHTADRLYTATKVIGTKYG